LFTLSCLCFFELFNPVRVKSGKTLVFYWLVSPVTVESSRGAQTQKVELLALYEVFGATTAECNGMEKRGACPSLRAVERVLREDLKCDALATRPVRDERTQCRVLGLPQNEASLAWGLCGIGPGWSAAST
jgi:hypothetical protein